MRFPQSYLNAGSHSPKQRKALTKSRAQPCPCLSWHHKFLAVFGLLCYLFVSTVIHGYHSCCRHVGAASVSEQSDATFRCCGSCCVSTKSQCVRLPHLALLPSLHLSHNGEKGNTLPGKAPCGDHDECPACRYLKTTLASSVPLPVSVPELFFIRLFEQSPDLSNGFESSLRPNSRAPPTVIV